MCCLEKLNISLPLKITCILLSVYSILLYCALRGWEGRFWKSPVPSLLRSEEFSSSSKLLSPEEWTLGMALDLLHVISVPCHLARLGKFLVSLPQKNELYVRTRVACSCFCFFLIIFNVHCFHFPAPCVYPSCFSWTPMPNIWMWEVCVCQESVPPHMRHD